MTCTAMGAAAPATAWPAAHPAPGRAPPGSIRAHANAGSQLRAGADADGRHCCPAAGRAGAVGSRRQVPGVHDDPVGSGGDTADVAG